MPLWTLYTRPMVLGLAATGALLAFCAFFNSSVVSYRVRELDRGLENAARIRKETRHAGLLIQYELLRRRPAPSEEDEGDYRAEAELRSLLRPGRGEKASLGSFLEPVAFGAIRLLRFVMGKETRPPGLDRPENRNAQAAYDFERRRRFVPAVKAYEAALHETPALRAEILLHQGFCRSLISDFGRARLDFREVTEAYPGSEEAAVAARLYQRMELIESALRKEAEAARLAGDLLSRARRLFQGAQYEKALALFTAFGRDHPRREEIRFYTGRCHEEMGEDSSALRCYRALADEFPLSAWSKKANQRILMIATFYEKDSAGAEASRRILSEKFHDTGFAGEIKKIRREMEPAPASQEADGASDKTAPETLAVSEEELRLQRDFRRIAEIRAAGSPAAEPAPAAESLKIAGRKPPPAEVPEDLLAAFRLGLEERKTRDAKRRAAEDRARNGVAEPAPGIPEADPPSRAAPALVKQPSREAAPKAPLTDTFSGQAAAPPSPEMQALLVLYRDEKVIHKIVWRKAGEWTGLYLKRLGEKPGLRGVLTLEFTIDPSGRVDSVAVVSSTLRDSILEQGTAALFLALKFEPINPSCGTVRSRYTIPFVPVENRRQGVFVK